MKKILTAILTLGLIAMFGASGVAASADDGSRYTVAIDETYLASAVVSELPVPLEGKVLDARGNFVYDRTLSWSVTEGENIARVEGSALYVSGEGSFTVRAEMTDDAAVFSEFTGRAVALTFSEVRILSKLEDLTVYTQPIKLTGTVTVEGIDFPEDVHKGLVYSVVSGPARILPKDYLQFTGAGTVVIKACSRYDAEASLTLTLEVTDPDAGKEAPDTTYSQGELTGSDAMGDVWRYVAVGVPIAALLASVIGLIIYFSKKK